MTKGSLAGYKYGGAIDRFPVAPGALFYVEGNAQGMVGIHDLMNDPPPAFFEATALFIDPPWGSGPFRQYYHKAQFELSWSYNEFLARWHGLLEALIRDGNIEHVGIEASMAERGLHLMMLRRLFGEENVVEHPALYYKTHPCAVVEARSSASSVPLLDVRGPLDEMDWLDLFVARLGPEHTILDFFAGRGATPLAAYRHGVNFIATDMAPNRLAVGLEALQKAGASVTEATSWST